MADLVARLTAAIASGAMALGSSACAASEPPKNPLASVHVAASFADTVFRDLDDATAEAYVLQSLGNGSARVADSQPCLLPDNRLSRRASVLANPPYAQASIDQRGRLIRALGAFAIAKVAIAHAKSAADVAPQIADFEAAAYDLHAVARVHAQGDLFIDDDAATLVALAGQLHAATTPDVMEIFTSSDAPGIGHMIGIIRTDVERARLQAIRASTFDAAVARAGVKPHVPACDEPVIPASAPAAEPRDASEISPSLRDARDNSIERANYLGGRSLDAFFDDLSTIAAASPNDTVTLDAALQHLTTEITSPSGTALQGNSFTAGAFWN